MGVGAELKRIRIENNKISVLKLATRVGVDPERWRKWEAKDLNPRDEDSVLIEKFFGVPISDLHLIHKITISSNVPGKKPNDSTNSTIKIKRAYVENFTRLN